MESACRKWGARRFRISLRIKGLGARRSRGRRERERDTGKSAEKGVSRMGYDSKAVERCSDTGNFGEKSVSRTGWEDFL